MKIYKISHNTMLDGYILNHQLVKIANISSNTYRFWKDVLAVKYDGCRAVFLKADTIPKKYKESIEKCTKLNGYVQSQAFCKYTGLPSSHLIKSNNSKLYNFFDILQIESIKFINLKKFYDDLELGL